MVRSRSDCLQGTLYLLVLKILVRRGPLHGYGIAVQIESISEDVLRVEEGSLYPALHRMEEAGWIAAEWVTTDNNRRARIYRLTATGERQLAAEEARWNDLSSAVAKVLQFA
jgi:PadR family transcriptional regulator, regulatory protein PadR